MGRASDFAHHSAESGTKTPKQVPPLLPPFVGVDLPRCKSGPACRLHFSMRCFAAGKMLSLYTSYSS
jgi:hypothetical protein